MNENVYYITQSFQLQVSSLNDCSNSLFEALASDTLSSWVVKRKDASLTDRAHALYARRLHF